MASKSDSGPEFDRFETVSTTKNHNLNSRPILVSSPRLMSLMTLATSWKYVSASFARNFIAVSTFDCSAMFNVLELIQSVIRKPTPVNYDCVIIILKLLPSFNY